MLNVNRHAKPVGRLSICIDVLVGMQSSECGDACAHFFAFSLGGIGVRIVLCHSKHSGTKLILAFMVAENNKISVNGHFDFGQNQFRLL